jgi:hypothetical protein
MLTALSIAAMWAKATAARKAVGRFLNGNAGLALVTVLGIVAVMVFLVWLRSDAAETAVAGRDATWKQKLAEQVSAATVLELAAERRGRAAAAEAVARAEEERDAAKARAIELERRIGEAGGRKVSGCDPQTELIPLSVVQAMRKRGRK